MADDANQAAGINLLVHSDSGASIPTPNDPPGPFSGLLLRSRWKSPTVHRIPKLALPLKQNEEQAQDSVSPILHSGKLVAAHSDALDLSSPSTSSNLSDHAKRACSEPRGLNHGNNIDELAKRGKNKIIFSRLSDQVLVWSKPESSFDYLSTSVSTQASLHTEDPLTTSIASFASGSSLFTASASRLTEQWSSPSLTSFNEIMERSAKLMSSSSSSRCNPPGVLERDRAMPMTSVGVLKRDGGAASSTSIGSESVIVTPRSSILVERDTTPAKSVGSASGYGSALSRSTTPAKSIGSASGSGSVSITTQASGSYFLPTLDSDSEFSSKSDINASDAPLLPILDSDSEFTSKSDINASDAPLEEVSEKDVMLTLAEPKSEDDTSRQKPWQAANNDSVSLLDPGAEVAGKVLKLLAGAPAEEVSEASVAEDKTTDSGGDALRTEMPAKDDEQPKLTVPTLERSTILGAPVKSLKKEMLSIMVFGALGDLAQRKMYPSLLKLFLNHFLPPWVSIVGYDTSEVMPEEFHAGLRPWLLSTVPDCTKVNMFLARCSYFAGSYNCSDDFEKLNQKLDHLERADGVDVFMVQQLAKSGVANRFFYFGIPPELVLQCAPHIKEWLATDKGFNRLVLEPPFGNDLESATKFVARVGRSIDEDFIYCIDEYLSKEVLESLCTFRYGNVALASAFDSDHISKVQIIFSEPFGTEGIGGYFAKHGIIRDVIQNTLMQLLCFIAMEPPIDYETGCPTSTSRAIRTAKNNLLRCIQPLNAAEVVLGQYVAAGGKPGFLEDSTITDKNMAKYVPTFAAMVMYIDNPRWAGVPFVLQAGKALRERKVEVRLQYKDSVPISSFYDVSCTGNELVVQLLSDESSSMTINTVEPEVTPKVTKSEGHRSQYMQSLDPYTRLMLEALHGTQSIFVRSNELFKSWGLFDPLLLILEKKEKRIPIAYKYGSSGPSDACQLLASCRSLRQEAAPRRPAPAGNLTRMGAEHAKQESQYTGATRRSSRGGPAGLCRSVRGGSLDSGASTPASSVGLGCGSQCANVSGSRDAVAAAVVMFERGGQGRSGVAGKAGQDKPQKYGRRSGVAGKAGQDKPQKYGRVAATISQLENHSKRSAKARVGKGAGKARSPKCRPQQHAIAGEKQAGAAALRLKNRSDSVSGSWTPMSQADSVMSQADSAMTQDDPVAFAGLLHGSLRKICRQPLHRQNHASGRSESLLKRILTKKRQYQAEVQEH